MATDHNDDGGVSRWLPPRFIEDCDECGCDIGEILIRSPTARRTLLRSTPEQYAELRNRAEHYAHVHGPDAAPAGLKAAAKALLAAMDTLDKVGV